MKENRSFYVSEKTKEEILEEQFISDIDNLVWLLEELCVVSQNFQLALSNTELLKIKKIISMIKEALKKADQAEISHCSEKIKLIKHKLRTITKSLN
ncbi:MAG: hypothetical protein GF364_04475 [Candidatus Lokiarchaeota archaeon]|nr:hypothetical protein [Candidatus Lokiarchaeota archaeon]